MFESVLTLIQNTYSGERAKGHVAFISQLHRIQASPGYREAAGYVRSQLHDLGLGTELLSFPANEDARFWTMQSFEEWACAKATLDLLSDGQRVQRLCDYQAAPISIIQRSAPAHGTFEVVAVEDGTDAAHYDQVDVAGKLVLTSGDVRRVYDLAVWRRGAVGILFDGMDSLAPGRSPLDLPDARQYTSFWWGKDEPRCFGFVLTPRQGRRLRAALPARVQAHVASRFYDGAFEVVTACIPGQTDEEVLVVSHLCHPRPSANDNASGAATAIEVAATLRTLISEGQLPLPKRSIRFLWVPEMTGTYAYLSTYEERVSRGLAGINLDMVGENQDRCHSTFTIERPPEAMASYAPVLLKRLWDLMPQAHAPDARRGGVRHAVSPFTGGSDHYILSDPTVGIPTPMLSQWPDRFYHTSEDTLDKVDSHSLALAGSLAAAYAYVLGNAGEREATWLAHEIVTRRNQRLAQLAQEAVTSILASEEGDDIRRAFSDLGRAIAHRIDRDKVALDSLRRLWSEATDTIQELSLCLDQAAQREMRRAEVVAQHRLQTLGSSSQLTPEGIAQEPWRSQADQWVPERLYRGPLSFHGAMDLSEEQRDALWANSRQDRRFWWTARVLAEYWVDGQRTVAEIADLVAQETGQQFGPMILAYFQLLSQHQLFNLHPLTLEPDEFLT